MERNKIVRSYLASARAKTTKENVADVLAMAAIAEAIMGLSEAIGLQCKGMPVWYDHEACPDDSRVSDDGYEEGAVCS